MKVLIKVLLFLALKIVEVGGIVFVPHYLGKLVLWTGFLGQHGRDCAPMWSIGSVTILFLCLIGLFIAFNWILADVLQQKFKK